jgi:putative transposase
MIIAAEFRRKPHRLAPEEYLGQRWYFVTMCCENRAAIFLAAHHAGWIIKSLQAESMLHQFLIDAYCVMPDHLQFLALGTASRSNLLKFVRNFKQKTAHAYVQETGARHWQKNYCDHILRSNEESSRVAAYIWLNPVRKGLCRDFQDYPYSGSFSRPWRAPIEASWIPPWQNRKMPA